MGRFGGYGYFRVFRLVQVIFFFPMIMDEKFTRGIFSSLFLFVSLLTWELMPHFWPQTWLLLCAMVRRWPSFEYLKIEFMNATYQHYDT